MDGHVYRLGMLDLLGLSSFDDTLVGARTGNHQRLNLEQAGSTRKRINDGGLIRAQPGIDVVEFHAGLPLDRHQRLLKDYRQRDHGDVTAQFPLRKTLQRRLSPAISCEESRWLLRNWRVRGALQIRGVTGGGEGISAAIRRRNLPIRTESRGQGRSVI
jgi:hypothetical protein